jgi:lipopolysaccharide biosynthesis protein
VVDQVAALAEAGRRVTFITNSARIAPRDADRLRPYVREVVHRRNFGHDFGAYKDGIARLGDLREVDSLVLMNDSCFGPFGGLARVEAAALASGADLFGITESWSIRYHLQTYYIWIGAAALRSAAFRAFWRGLLASQPRSMVIANGEIAFTQKLLRAGFTARALCPYAEVAALARQAADRRLADGSGLLAFERNHLEALVGAVLAGADLNPTHSFWDVLLTECGSPFVKRELLRHNPLRIPGVSQWERLLADQPAAQLDAIRDSLKRG